MSSDQKNDTPWSYGEAVTNAAGRIGVVTEPARRTGPNMGRVTVWWIGAAYEVSEWPEELTAADVRLA